MGEGIDLGRECSRKPTTPTKTANENSPFLVMIYQSVTHSEEHGNGENGDKSVEQRLGLDLAFFIGRALPFRRIQICATFPRCHGKMGHPKSSTKGKENSKKKIKN